MNRLFQYLKGHQVHLNTAILCSIINKLFDLMPPLLVGWIIDTVRGTPPHWMTLITGDVTPFNLATLLSGLAVVIFAFESLFQWAYQYGFMTLAQAVQHDIRVRLYAHLQTREMAFFESHRLGNTLSLLNDDVNQLERFLNTGLNDLIQLGVLMGVSGAILFGISWQLAIVGVMPIPIIIAGSLAYQRMLSPRYKAVRASVGALNSRLENNLSGMMVIQSFTAESIETERVSFASMDYRTQNTKAIRYSSAYTPVIRMAVVLGFAGVLMVGSYWVLTGSGVLTVGELVLFAMMTERLLWPLTRLGATLDDVERAKASIKRLFECLDTPSSIREQATPVTQPVTAGGISFEAVQFAYPISTEIPILKKLTLTIKPGQTIGIAGRTGCGKSTLIKLLMRFYDPVSGRITIDGVDSRAFSLKTLRESIALVSQDVYLFHGTIYENIAYGNPAASMDAVSRAATLAEFHTFVLGLPDGYQTIVGERGIRLSGGQRQRLSIARAILKQAPIMVFDEATSAVDTETEKAIQDNLDRLIDGKTAVIIAHRLSTIRHADCIFVLDDGEVAEHGTHDDLIARPNGIYADLWHTQIGQHPH